MASQPTAMAARNWMMRRLLIETIRRDPDYANGDYTRSRASMKIANCSMRRHQWRHARLSEARADQRAGRQVRRRAARRAVQRRRQRLSLRLGIPRATTIRRRASRRSRRRCLHQCGRRRAQPARDRHHRGCAQAHQERAASADSGERGDARPRHHRAWRSSTRRSWPSSSQTVPTARDVSSLPLRL